MSPKIPLEKNKEKKNRKSEKKEEKKAMAALLPVMLTSLEIVFERENCLMGKLCFGCNLLKNPTRYIFFLLLQLTGICLIKKRNIFLKRMIK